MGFLLILNLARQKMKKTYNTRAAAKKMRVSFRTLNRWLAQGTIKPSKGFPLEGGRTLWRWTDADIAKGRKIKARLRPGPKPRKRRKP
jgi:hypothetical protein